MLEAVGHLIPVCPTAAIPLPELNWSVYIETLKGGLDAGRHD